MLEANFFYSQHNLGDFLDCPRRFYLQYIAKQPWPLITENIGEMDALTYREYLRQGVVLHRWIERFWLGLADKRMTDSSFSDRAKLELETWWTRFLAEDFRALPAQRVPELELVTAIEARSIYARYDLLAVEDGKAVIIDWKTTRLTKATTTHFWRNRLQTRVYLYVLACAGSPFNNGNPIPPENCIMRYWLANAENDEHRWVEIDYSQSEFDTDHRRLSKLISEIERRDGEANFEKTNDQRKCAFCTYRTLCDRQFVAEADLPDEERLIDVINDVPELEY
jgi:CRISPR/Cas system-associated exonuclease Cas4 (RecB family)